MNVVLVKSRAGTYIPATEEDRTKLRAVKPGEAFPVRIGKPRRIETHRQFFACLSFVTNHHPDYQRFGTVEPLLETLKKVTRHVKTWTIQSTGEILESTRSIAFDELDEGDFLGWLDKAKPFIVELMEQFPERTKRRHTEEIDDWTHWCLH